MRRAAVVLVVLGLAAPGWPSPPEAPALAPGARLRLTGKSPFSLPGLLEVEKGRVVVLGARVLVNDDDRILFEAAGSTFLVPRDGRAVAGRLAAVEADAFVIQFDHPQALGPVRVPRAAVSALEVSRPRGSRLGNAAKGLLFGAAIGATVGLISSAGCGESDWFCSAGFNAWAGAILLAPIGALGGATMPVERWQAVSTDAPAAVGVTATPGQGVAVALSLRF